MLGKNRVNELAGLVVKIYANHPLSATSERFEKLSAEFSNGVIKGEAISQQRRFYQRLWSRHIPVKIAGYHDALFAEIKNKKNDEKALLALTDKQANGLSAVVIELTAMLVEADSILKKAAQNQRKLEAASGIVKNFFGSTVNVHRFYHGGLNIAEAASLLKLMDKVLSHRVMRTGVDEQENQVRLNFNKLSRSIAKHAIDSFVPELTDQVKEALEDMNEFAKQLQKISGESCALLMKRLQKLYLASAGRYKVIYEQVREHAFLLDNAIIAAKTMRNSLSYDDVSWIKDAKLYDINEFKNHTWRSLDRFGDYVHMASIASISLAYINKLIQLNDKQNLTDENIAAIHSRMDSYRHAFYLILGSIAFSMLMKPHKDSSPRLFVFPSLEVRLGDMFRESCEWGSDKIAKVAVDTNNIINNNDSKPTDIDEGNEIFYDALDEKEDVFYDVERVRVFMSDEEKMALIKSHYTKTQLMVELNFDGAEILFGNDRSRLIERVVDSNRRHYFNLQNASRFFIDDEFQAEAFREDLMVSWNCILDVHDKPGLVLITPEERKKLNTPVVNPEIEKPQEPVPPAVVIFSKPVTVAERKEETASESDDNGERFESILVQKYDLLLIAKLLIHIESTDKKRYDTLISQYTDVTPAQIVSEVADDTQQRDDDRNAYYEEALAQLTPLFDKNANIIEPVQIYVDSLPTVGNNVGIISLVNKLERVKKLIDEFYQVNNTGPIPTEKKKAYIMAIVEAYQLWKQIESLNDAPMNLVLTPNENVLERFKRVHDAFEDYNKHRLMTSFSNGDLKTIVANHEFICTIQHNKKKNTI